MVGNAIATVVGFIQANWPLVSIALMPVLAPLYLIISILQLVRSNFGTVVSWFQSGASQISGFINGIRDAWNSFASGMMSAYNTYVKPVIDGLNTAAQAAQAAWDAINGTSGGTAGGYMSAAGGDLSTIEYPEKNYYEINFNGLGN